VYKGTNKITIKGLGLKLTNSLSFGESVISTGFNQKTIKADLHVRVNYAILEDSRGLHTEAGDETLPCGAGRDHLQTARPLGSTCQPLVAMSIFHHLLGCISAIP
jgi:hypothetical protein